MERVSLVYKWKEDACCLLTQAQHVHEWKSETRNGHENKKEQADDKRKVFMI